MASSAGAWLCDEELFRSVLRMNQALFAGAVWDSVDRHSVELIPNDDALRALAIDYRSMHEMFFRIPEPPTWQQVVDEVRELQERLGNSP